MSGIKSLFSELRRRRVLRASAFYIAGAWLLLQVVSVVFPIFDIGDQYQRYTTIALFFGFPLAIVLSWLFDFDLGHVTRTTAKPAAVAVVTDSDSDVRSRFKQLPVRSIGVMPFANVGSDAEKEYFSDGIAEELINLLSKSQDLNVAARTSSFSFKQTDSTVQEVALRLGVRHILEGSVRWEQSRVRITVQLIDALSGFQVWSSSYDRELVEIFAVQDEISSSIVYALSAAIDQTIGGTKSLRVEAPTRNIEAYQLYLRGMYLWQRRGTTAIQAAIGALEQAIEIDPDYVDAISLLSVATAVLHEYSGTDREVDFERAKAYALRAMKIEPNTSMAHAVLGYIAVRRWKWVESDKHFKLAMSHDSGEPLVHQWYSNVLNDLGYHKRALVHAQKAYHADRLSPQANNILALNFLLLGENKSAVAHGSVAREFGLGGAVPDWVEYFVRLREKNFDAAIAIMESSLKRRNLANDWVKPTVDAIEDGALQPSALAALDEARASGALGKSLAFMQYVLLHAGDQVFEVANSQLSDHSLGHLWLFLPEAKPLHSDARFKTLMDSMALTSYWEEFGWPEQIELSRPG